MAIKELLKKMLRKYAGDLGVAVLVTVFVSVILDILGVLGFNTHYHYSAKLLSPQFIYFAVVFVFIISAAEFLLLGRRKIVRETIWKHRIIFMSFVSVIGVAGALIWVKLMSGSDMTALVKIIICILPLFTFVLGTITYIITDRITVRRLNKSLAEYNKDKNE